MIGDYSRPHWASNWSYILFFMLSSKLALGSANSKSIFNSLTIYINESFLPEHAPSVKPSLTVDDQLFKVNTGTGTVHFFFEGNVIHKIVSA